jgi:hypothetical protein
MTDISGYCDTNNGVFPANAVGAKKMTVEIRGTSIGGSLDGAPFHFRNVTLPKTGYLGITAATGNGFSAHVVTSVVATSCP